MLMQPPITDMIQQPLSEDVDALSAEFGWELFPFPRANQFYINVPAFGEARQWVQNTITSAWTQFRGYVGMCWERMQEEAFFGGSGFVGHGWTGTTDDPTTLGVGKSIATVCLQAFNYFDSPAQKVWSLARPIFTSPSEPAAVVQFNVDFQIETESPALPVVLGPAIGSHWDEDAWDEATWTGGTASWRRWYGLDAIGFAGAVFIRTATVEETSWISTDFVYIEGNIL
jgi:hypothetical protein